MEKKKNKKGVYGRAHAIFKRVVEQANSFKEQERKQQINSNIEYMWICNEVKKEKQLQMKQRLLQSLIGHFSKWYEKYHEKTSNMHVGLFFVKMIHFLYQIQFEKLYMDQEIVNSSIQIEVSQTVFMFLLYNSYCPEIKTILLYFIRESALKITMSWDEYIYVTNKKCQLLGKHIDYLFLSDAADISEIKRKYLKEKEAYLLIQSLFR